MRRERRAMLFAKESGMVETSVKLKVWLNHDDSKCSN